MKTFPKWFSSKFYREQIIKDSLHWNFHATSSSGLKWFGFVLCTKQNISSCNVLEQFAMLHDERSPMWKRGSIAVFFFCFYSCFPETTTDINTAGGREGVRACECRPCLCICASAARVRDAVYHVNQPGVQHYLPAFVVNRMTAWREAEEDGTDRR